MTLSGWIWIAVGAILVFFLLPTMLMSGIIYTVLLVRTKPEKWDRSCSIPDDEEYVGMFREGLAWEEKWKEHFSQPLRTGRVPGETLDFFIICSLAEEEKKKAWRQSQLEDVKDYILKQL